jgi:hypothetical protein
MEVARTCPIVPGAGFMVPVVGIVLHSFTWSMIAAVSGISVLSLTNLMGLARIRLVLSKLISGVTSRIG